MHKLLSCKLELQRCTHELLGCTHESQDCCRCINFQTTGNGFMQYLTNSQRFCFVSK